MSDVLAAYAQAARAGIRDMAVTAPWRIRMTSTWPRAVFQCLFFTLLGRLAGGSAGEQFAFPGSVAMIVTLPTVNGIAGLVQSDKWMGTFYRLQLSRRSTAGIFLAKSVPNLIDALITVVLAIAVVGALTGQLGLAVRVAACLPLYVVIILTSAAAGHAVAAASMGRRVDTLLGNLFMYLVIAAGGIVVQPGRAPWLDDLGSVLPVRYGLLAVRAALGSGSYLRPLLEECAAGLAWALAAWLIYSFRVAYARRSGTEMFT